MTGSPWNLRKCRQVKNVGGGGVETPPHPLHDVSNTVYAVSNTEMEILKFFGNWIIIIHNWLFYKIFAFLAHFAAKILQFLGFLRISCYLEIILKGCEISWDLKKILEGWQHWSCTFSEKSRIWRIIPPVFCSFWSAQEVYPASAAAESLRLFVTTMVA